MRAIEISQPGGPEVLHLVERPVPEPSAGEVRVRVRAAGVNRPDVMQRLGLYPPPAGASDLPGLEVAGVVDAVAADVTALRVGDAVCALLSGGGYAEFAVAPAVQCLPLPWPEGAEPEAAREDRFVRAAALPEAVCTVWTNLVDLAGLASGETLLVHGGTSGIGTAAIQIATALGATVFTTVGSEEKRRAAEALGARVTINYRTDDFVEAVKTATGGRGVDVILDIVGGDYLDRNLRALAPGGRLVQIAVQAGPKATIDLARVMTRRLTITGSTLRPRGVAEKGALLEAVRRQVWPMIAEGRVRPVIDAVFPLAEAADAHRRLESGVHVGKIVLRA